MNALTQALKRRDQLRAEIAKLDEFIQMYRSLEAQAAEAAEDHEASRQRATKRDQILAGAEEVLRLFGALEIPDLLSALKANGIEVGGANEATNLSSYLSKSPRFKAVRGIGWVLAERAAENKTSPDGTGQPGTHVEQAS